MAGVRTSQGETSHHVWRNILDTEVYKANAFRLVSSFCRVSSTLPWKMCSQEYNFSSLIPRNISFVFFRRSLEFSYHQETEMCKISNIPDTKHKKYNFG